MKLEWEPATIGFEAVTNRGVYEVIPDMNTWECYYTVNTVEHYLGRTHTREEAEDLCETREEINFRSRR